MIQEFRVGPHHLLFELQPEEFTSDRNLLWYVYNNQLPEPEVIHVMQRALKPGDCAVDAGANVGFFTVLMSKIVGARGRIIAVEPDTRNAAKLRKNLDINSCDNVQVCECALGETNGYTSLYRGADNGQISVFGNGEYEMVPFRRLDALLGDYCPRFMKMDIEGSEVAALSGCSWGIPCVVSEVNKVALQRAGQSPENLFNRMYERGYRRYQIHADGSMPARIQRSQSVKLTRENANVLFAHACLVPEIWPEVEI